MKTIKQIIQETVDKPRSPDEQHFIDKHAVEIIDYPVKNEDPKKNLDKSKSKREADYGEDEDKKIYEDTTFKLKDGNSITISEEDSIVLSKLFSRLNPSNKKKMEEKLYVNKNSFNEILSFAKASDA